MRAAVRTRLALIRARRSLNASVFAPRRRVTIGVMDAPVISNEVLARYAGDAALEVDGVCGLARDAAEISGSDGVVDIDVHVELEWGAGAGGVARRVQERVTEYIEGMANVHVGSVDVVVERVGAPPAKQ